MKDPAFLFYSSDFLSDTILMTNEEVGIYIKLLCLQHQQGHLKKDDMLSLGTTNKIMNKFIVDSEGTYYNEDLENEIIRRKAYSESRRNNRQKNICKTYDKDMNNICKSYDKHMETITITNTTTKTKKDREKGVIGEKEKGKEETEKIHFADFVTMSNDEYQKLVVTHGKDFADQCITVLDNYKGSSGKTYKSDYRAILSWVVDTVKQKTKVRNSNVQNGWDYIDDEFNKIQERRNNGEGTSG